jgi:hypothetical protein
MPAQRYQDLQRPSLVETGIVQQNAGTAAERLSQVLGDFGSTTQHYANQLFTEKGDQQGAAAGNTDKPSFREGFKGMTAYGKAYNNAAMRTYAIRQQSEADELATRLESEAGDDPEKFKASYAAARDAVLKEAHPMAAPIVREIYDRRLGAGVSRLAAAQQEGFKKEARSAVAEGISQSVDTIGQLRASNDPAKRQQADEEAMKLHMLIDSSVNDGTISATEAGALKLDADRTVIKTEVLERFKHEYDDPYGDPVGFIEDVKKANQTSNKLPPQEEEKLVDSLFAELRDRNALRSARVSAGAAAEKARFDEGDRVATSALLSGSLTRSNLLHMVQGGDLDPSVGRVLLNELQSGDPGVSDPQAKFHVETNLLSTTEDDIRTNSALSWKDRGELILKRREEGKGWKGTQAAKEGGDRIDRALGLLPGTNTKMLTPEEAGQRDTALTEWYNQIESLPPEQRDAQVIPVAEQVAEKYIKRNAAIELNGLQSRKDAYVRAMGDPSDMSEGKRKQYEAKLANYDNQIRAAAQKAK